MQGLKTIKNYSDIRRQGRKLGENYTVVLRQGRKLVDNYNGILRQERNSAIWSMCSKLHVILEVFEHLFGSKYCRERASGAAPCQQEEHEVGVFGVNMLNFIEAPASIALMWSFGAPTGAQTKSQSVYIKDISSQTRDRPPPRSYSYPFLKHQHSGFCMFISLSLFSLSLSLSLYTYIYIYIYIYLFFIFIYLFM